MLEELVTVANRPKFRKYFSKKDLIKLLYQINKNSEFINANTIVELCRDPKDNFLLSLTHDGNATHILTGDKDLIELAKYKKTVILSINDYFKDL